MQRRLGLNVGGEDLGVTAKVHEKCVAPHLPLTLTTSKGTLRSRYSRVEPMWMPWPCRGGLPEAFSADAKRERNLLRVRGR